MKMTLEQLRDAILDELEKMGNGTSAALEFWNDFRTEVKALKPGTYTYTVGNFVFTFTKKG